jgi:hypothetical protein
MFLFFGLFIVKYKIKILKIGLDRSPGGQQFA